MQQLSSPSRESARPEKGQATVEFALILPVLALLLFAALEFGTAFWHYQQLSAAASEGARKAAVSRSATNRSAIVTAAVRDASPSLKASDVGVSMTSTWSPGDPVTIMVTYPEEIGVMGIPFFTGNLVSKRTARVEH